MRKGSSRIFKRIGAHTAATSSDGARKRRSVSTLRTLRYVDFDLRIERDGSRYTARVLESPAGEAASSFTLPLTGDKVENLILKIGRRLSDSVRRIHSTEMAAAKELGGSLFDALFTG